MADIPDSVDLQWVGRRLVALGDDIRALRTGVDMLTRIALRVGNTLSAAREDIRSLWGSQADLRRRIERLEG
jgi:hypothetical protein